MKQSVLRSKDKEMIEAVEYFGCSNQVKSSIFDNSKSSYLDDSINSVMDVITSYGQEIYESKF